MKRGGNPCCVYSNVVQHAMIRVAKRRVCACSHAPFLFLSFHAFCAYIVFFSLPAPLRVPMPLFPIRALCIYPFLFAPTPFRVPMPLFPILRCAYILFFSLPRLSAFLCLFFLFVRCAYILFFSLPRLSAFLCLFFLFVRCA
ncbi:MAG: hypothetical protein BYD32DRAFT_417484 [Podila humilis]|nr:MAG: hypothetical protein BYD32DRAFT_417484 [Podila humilis]